MPKISTEYLDIMVNAGHLTPEGKAAILQAQETGAPRPKYYRVKLTPEQLEALQDAFPDLTFQTMFEARKGKK